jgi:hypothetical protein
LTPTYQVEELLDFTSTVYLTGMTSATLDTNAQKAILNSTAKAMGIDQDDLTITQTSIVSTAVASATFTNGFIGSKGIDIKAVTYSLNVTVEVTVNMVDYSQDASTVYSTLTTSLKTSSSSGTLSQYVQQAATIFGSSSLSSVTASVVSTSAASVVNPPSFGPTVAPSSSTKIASTTSESSSITSSKSFIAGIAVGGFAFVVFTAIFIFAMKRWRDKTLLSSSVSQDEKLQEKNRNTSSIEVNMMEQGEFYTLYY